jgi:FkbM family methyltransferase
VGANIGVMTSLLSLRTGEQGQAFGFEAHPHIFRQLERNVLMWNRPRLEVFNCAASHEAGLVRLEEAAGFELNEGTARVAKPGNRTRSFEVKSVRLDDALPRSAYGVVKIDVEGHELEVLRGALNGLAAHRFRDVVFESTWDYPGPAHELLISNGYRIFEILVSLNGPKLTPVKNRFEAPGRLADYLATADPVRAGKLVGPAGWQALHHEYQAV